MDYTLTVPIEAGRNYGIFAYLEDILALAHFYPIVAVYDDEGWNIDPPASDGDVIFADTSFYMVTVSAPVDLLIATSGIEIGRQTADGTQVNTYAAGPMRDFYLAASGRYSALSRQVGQTKINSYAPTELADGAEAVLDITEIALESFSRRFGPYPFTELDIVSTPTLALGVEYPGIFANAIRIYDLDATNGELPNRVYLESVTVHETGHQWFYSIIGNGCVIHI
jgi:aminopeptidase N